MFTIETKKDLLIRLQEKSDINFIGFNLPLQTYRKGSVGPYIFSSYHVSHFPAPIEDNSTYAFHCLEQYLSYWKAVLSKDFAMAEKMLTIINANPYVYKQLGNHIIDSNNHLWEKMRVTVMYLGLQAKFTYYPAYRDYLIGTDDAVLVLSTMDDMFWGAGVTPKHRHLRHPDKWPGENTLGFVLMHLRKNLKGD